MREGTTAVVPTIPPRRALLARAIMSISNQTHPVQAISVAIDNNHEGSGPTRTRAMRAVQTEWTAFLDDDDQWMSHHLQHLVDLQHETGADFLWPWFQVIGGGTDPFPQHRGRQWDPSDPHIIPVCTLVRTELAQQCEFPHHTVNGYGGDDFGFTLQMSELGAKFAHTPEISFLWDHAPPGGNTSGLPHRW
jgi:hypothetical protein